jgi:hypothetical protein
MRVEHFVEHFQSEEFLICEEKLHNFPIKVFLQFFFGNLRLYHYYCKSINLVLDE